VAAANFADEAQKVSSLITEWFGPQREKAKTADLPDSKAAPFESGALLLTPLSSEGSKLAGLAAAHQLTHASFLSFRPWIEEGLAHFAQALYLEHEKNRQAALDYMGSHRVAFSEAETSTTLPRSEDEVNRALVNTTSDELYRSKAMYVWWMLRDMVGDAALKKAIAAYRPEQDKDPSYMPRLIAAQTQRDLGWFFDDWVYRDRGLPDFKVESAFSRKTPTNSFMVTITVDNLGGAGAEVPVTVKFAGGDITKRLEVRARSKASIRVEVPAAPEEIVVNDGSVPESDMSNNVFKIEAGTK
jgi:aminopeptidase N